MTSSSEVKNGEGRTTTSDNADDTGYAVASCADGGHTIRMKFTYRLILNESGVQRDLQ